MKNSFLQKINRLIYSGEDQNIKLAIEIAKGHQISENEILKPWIDLLEVAEIKNDDIANSIVELFSRKHLVFGCEHRGIKYHKNILPKNLWKLKYLKELSLDHLNLGSIPNKIENLEAIEVLSITNNNLKRLPYSIGKMKHIEGIHASQNLFKEFPSSILKLHTLKVLDLGYSKFTHLPEKIKNLKKLKWIALTDNPFSNEEKIKAKRLLPHCEVIFKL